MKCILILTAALFLPGCAGFFARMREADARQVRATARFYAQERAETMRRWEASLPPRRARAALSADPVARAIQKQTRVLKEIADQQFLEWAERSSGL